MQTCHCANVCFVSYILQGCVFSYQRNEAIKLWQVFSDALFNILSTGMDRGEKWIVKVQLNKADRKRTKKMTSFVQQTP